jgi:adenylate cyclase
MFKRIKYISRFAKPLTPQEIDEIARVSKENNEKKDLTGALMASGGLFFQVVEGPKEAVDELWTALLKDPRHKDILLLRTEEGDLPRLFPEWRMKKVDLDRTTGARIEPIKAILQTVLRQTQVIYDLTGVLERAAWAEMVEVE